MNPDDLRRADAIEVVVGQGAKPGGGGMLLGQKISDRVAEMRDLPKGVDQRSACRHPDWTGPDDLEIKIGELREITDWRKPIYVKIGATRTYFDVALAVKAGADVIVLDGMEGGTAASQEVFIEHVGIPILAAIPEAVRSLQELGMHRKVQLIVSGGIRSGADAAKALALGADAVSIGVAAVIALGDNSHEFEAAYEEIGTSAGYYDDWHEGRDPVGISTQDEDLAAPLRPRAGREAAGQLPAGDGARGADAGAGLRQVSRAQPRAGGHGRADPRGGGDGQGAAGRHRLDPGQGRPPLSRNLVELVRRHHAEQAPTALDVLKGAMDARGEITDEDRERAAELSGLPEAAVHGVSTFYDDLLQPRGRRHVRVCTGTACFAATGDEHVRELREGLGLELGRARRRRRGLAGRDGLPGLLPLLPGGAGRRHGGRRPRGDRAGPRRGGGRGARAALAERARRAGAAAPRLTTPAWAGRER